MSRRLWSRAWSRMLPALALVAQSGCGEGDAQGGGAFTTVPIGVVIDSTSTASFRTWPAVGNMAIKQLNDGLAKAGSAIRFKLLLADTAQSDKITVMRSIDLVRNQGAKAIVTDTSKNAIEVTKLMYDLDPANDINVPIVCVTCTAPGLNNPTAIGTDDVDTATLRDAQKWNFRTVNRATEQTAVLKRVILEAGNNGDVNGDNKFKISVIVLDDASGHGYARSTQMLFAESKPAVIVEKVLVTGANLDLNNARYWDDVAARMIDANSDCPQDPASANGCLPIARGDGAPDALMENLNPGYNIAVSHALARANNKITFFHAHAFRATVTTEVLRAAVNGQQGVSAVLYDHGSPSGRQFAGDLKAITGNEPAVLDGSVYDAVMTVALAALKAVVGMSDPARLTGEQVRDALGQINQPAGEIIRVGPGEVAKAHERLSAGAPINYEGASGPVDFDADGNIWMKLARYQGINGAFKDIDYFDCVRDPSCPIIPP